MAKKIICSLGFTERGVSCGDCADCPYYKAISPLERYQKYCDVLANMSMCPTSQALCSGSARIGTTNVRRN